MLYYDEYGDDEFAEYHVFIADGTKVICNSACENCEYARSFYIPSSVTHIGIPI